MSKNNLSILIVDDNRSFVRRMKSLLSEGENIYTIHTAHNYDEGFVLLDKKPDLAILDIQMPGKNGIDLLKGIKNSANDCEVIMLTNNADEYYREKCRQLGAFCFFDKTNDFELVPAMIKNFAIQSNYKTS